MKKIRLIEFFAGYGSQALALKYLGIPFEHWKICEWAVKSIQAYKDIHFENDNTDYSKDISKEQLIQRLNYFGISSNYNEPMTLEQIKRLNESQLRTIFSNIVCTNNLVNIQNVKGEDLQIVDTDKYDYMLTYSFPCQDLSMAGKRKGMSDTSTRSGMLWEVERILKECENKPQILLMENVPQVHGKKNIEDFNKWINSLEEMGYKNYWQDLIATDYGIPQTRKRTFMVSILGDEKFEFPKPIPLELKLKDLLEENVDEKYYLSDKMINCFINPSESGKKFGRDKQFLKSFENEEIARTITTRAGNRASDNFILTKDTENYIEWKDGKNIQMNCRAWKEDKVVATLNCGGETKILKRELCNQLVQNGLVEEGDVVKHSFTQQILDGNKKCVEKNDGTMITLTTRPDCVGVCVKGIATNESKEWQKKPLNEKSRTILANKSNGGVGCIDSNLRIRKLTPKECFRLMGVKDEDYENVAKNQSNASLYHLAGDSIVVDVLCHIFKKLFIDTEDN